MMEVSRRHFISGVLAIAGTMAPTKVVDQIIMESRKTFQPDVWLRQWYLDIAIVISQVNTDVAIYGMGASRICSAYPYVERVDPSTVQIEQYRAISND